MVRVRYASKIEMKHGTLVRYGSRCEVRSTQILNVPYSTAILACRFGLGSRIGFGLELGLGLRLRVSFFKALFQNVCANGTFAKPLPISFFFERKNGLHQIPEFRGQCFPEVTYGILKIVGRMKFFRGPDPAGQSLFDALKNPRSKPHMVKSRVAQPKLSIFCRSL